MKGAFPLSHLLFSLSKRFMTDCAFKIKLVILRTGVRSSVIYKTNGLS